MNLNLRKTLSPFLGAAMLLSWGLCMACSSDKDVDKPVVPVDPDDEEYQDIEVIDGKVRFYLSESKNSVRQAMGAPERVWSEAVVAVNGKTYPVATDDNKRSYVEVTASKANAYNATLMTATSSEWYGSSAYTDLKLPYSQFWTKTGAALASYPMYGAYSKEDGNKMVFKDPFAVVDVALTGSAKIASVKVRNLGDHALAGVGNYLPSTGHITVNEGVNFAVLNCTDEGNFVALEGDAPSHFYVMLAAGDYPEGLEITVTDADHLALVHTLTAPQLLAGEAKTVDLKYAPDSDLLFFESFDNMVWGGNIMGGQESIGYAPNAETITPDAGLDRNGYADAFTQVAYNNPGSAFIQSNTWNDVSGQTVGKSHQMSDSYVQSRNLADYCYLFRSQEYQGLLACGTGNTGRGIFQTGALQTNKGVNSIKVEFDFCYQYGSTDVMLFQILNGGMITAATVDGKNIALTEENSGYMSNASKLIVEKNYVTVPTGESAVKEWHHVEIDVKNATDGTMLYWAGNDSSNGVHGFYLDNIVARKVGEMERGSKNLRVLYWNIQNGMWSDQANNYKTFVEWVKKYDPDVCVWCESATIYKDNTGTKQDKEACFLPDGWAALAARYGHSYVAVGGWRDNYPQTVTSKYPIETLLKITDSDVAGKPVSHGAAIQQVDVNGRKINFVTLHTWPQAYAYGVSKDDQAASAANKEGDKYREFEIQYICNQTINNPTYAGVEDWLMMGDFNSRSRVDNWYYGYPADDTRLLVHNFVLDHTIFKDIIGERNPTNFVSSTYGNARIDFMYASPAMDARVVNALIVIDKWTTSTQSPYVSNFYDPSDHRPILVDFELK